MKVLEETSTRLVIQIRPVGLWIMCIAMAAIFAAFGFFAGPIFAFFTGNDLIGNMMPKGILGPQLLGYSAVIPLAVAVFLLKTRTLSFDTASGLIRISRRGLLGSGEDEYPLSAFHGAHLAHRRSQNTTTYRAILMFSDPPGNIQVTPYGTSGSGPSRLVSKVNEWLMKARGMQSGADGAFTATIPGFGTVTVTRHPS